MFLFVRAYFELILFDLYLVRGNFASLYNKVQKTPLRTEIRSSEVYVRICQMIDIACICYWKRVLCLQRSAATTCLLRKYGVPATLVIGAQQVPFKSHAWVEVDDKVINDKSYVPEMYAVLDKF